MKFLEDHNLAFYNNRLISSQELERRKKEEPKLDFSEVREIFERDFIGIEEAEKFTGHVLTVEEKRIVEKKWNTKVGEQKLTKESLEQLKQEGFMVVLRCPTLTGTDKKSGEMPVTINNLRKKFPLFYKQDWYDKESFPNETLKDFDWAIVKKEVLPESKSKNWDEQQEILKSWAKVHNIDEQFVRRRTPTEVAYDILAYFKIYQERIMEKDWDWTSIQSSGGGFVGVGYFDAAGLYVSGHTRDNRYSHLGVCPSR
jgi:hypothetical protein